MKRKKLKIQELKIQSFITELDPEIAKTAKGGDDTTFTSTFTILESHVTVCPTNPTNTNQTKSWFPYEDSAACTKVTTTTGTTTTI